MRNKGNNGHYVLIFAATVADKLFSSLYHKNVSRCLVRTQPTIETVATATLASKRSVDFLRKTHFRCQHEYTRLASTL